MHSFDPRRLRRELWLPAALLVIQLAGAAATSAHQGPHGTHLDVFDWLLVVLGPIALSIRARHPVAVLWVTFAATLAPSGSWVCNLSLIVAFFTVSVSGRRRVAWLVIVVGYVCSVWLAPLVYGQATASLEFALLLGGWLMVLAVAAEVVRLRRERAAQAHAARQLDTRHRASEQRLRMARDLHDVIGHNISLINVQAGVALDLIDTQPNQARVALAAIKTVSKEALEELRTMLAALRESGEHAPRTPTPGLEQLPELIELTSAGGLAVSTNIDGHRRPLPSSVDLAAYRIIQESLTNVTRHAHATSAEIRLTYEPTGVRLEITDNGEGQPAANGSSPQSATGSGIIGMRERAAALGGSLHAARRAEGGFAVCAWLPTGGSA